VESDLTEYSPLFTTAQTGQADIGNLVNSTYTGIIYASAELLFYPAEPNGPPLPQVFDQVLPLTTAPGTVALSTPTSTLAQTFTLPTNIQEAYLDVLAQSQNVDEFWYTCVPNNVTAELGGDCGSTGFREGEVTIDGQPAGVVPIYPWIFTGGIDPFLWFPLPGVQTLNFVPYRVNLTPFAGVLDNGQPHTVALSVFNADNYFSATATLLLSLDPNVTEITGGVTENTLTPAPNPKVIEHLPVSSNGDIVGTLSVTSNRHFTIAGYITTEKGKVETTLKQSINFSNLQYYNLTSADEIENFVQQTDIASTTTQKNGGDVTVTTQSATYPLTLGINFVINGDGSADQTTTVRQENYSEETVQKNGVELSNSIVDNLVTPADTLEFDSSGNFTGNSNQQSSQQYYSYKSNGACYDEILTAANNVLTADENGCTGAEGKKTF
jgi:hypothetical protein